MQGSVALISIHPEYVDMIHSGKKRLEFRRSWAVSPVDFLVIYATAPVQQLVSIAQVSHVHRGSKTYLWRLAQRKGGGVSRRKLFAYMADKAEGVALELSHILKMDKGIDPKILFGVNFHPPQSFRYLSADDFAKLVRHLGNKVWG